MSGDIFSCGMRGVISTSSGMCCRGMLYFRPIVFRLLTILENSGRDVGCCLQHDPIIWAASFVHR